MIGQRSVVDIPTALIAVTTVAILWRFKRLSEPVVVLAAALLGMLIYPSAGYH